MKSKLISFLCLAGATLFAADFPGPVLPSGKPIRRLKIREVLLLE